MILGLPVSFAGSIIRLERFSDELHTTHTNPTRKRGDRLCVWGRARPASLAFASRVSIIRHRGLFVHNSRVNHSSIPHIVLI